MPILLMSQISFISIHAPPRGATTTENSCKALYNISIHAPPRGATGCYRAGYGGTHFNSRPSARGDPDSAHYVRGGAYFNSRPSARGDWNPLAPANVSSGISIHAPPRGATMKNDMPEQMLKISIHAPPRGATPRRKPCRRRRADFNSRPSARGDDNALHILLRFFISIHAPPRGATAKDMQFLQIFCSTLTNQHGLTIVPRNLSRLFW